MNMSHCSVHNSITSIAVRCLTSQCNNLLQVMRGSTGAWRVQWPFAYLCSSSTRNATAAWTSTPGSTTMSAPKRVLMWTHNSTTTSVPKWALISSASESQIASIWLKNSSFLGKVISFTQVTWSTYMYVHLPTQSYRCLYPANVLLKDFFLRFIKVRCGISCNMFIAQ